MARAISAVEAAAERHPTSRPLRSASFLGQLKHHPKGAIAAAVLLVVAVAAIFAPVLSPYQPNHQDFLLAKAGPSWSHPLGLDELGRDVLTRILYGARVSLTLAVAVVVIAATVGSLIGATAGFFGGFVDTAIMRIADVLLVFPWLLLALLLVTILGPGIRSIVVALSLVLWLHYARVVRGETMKLRELEFIEAARAIGASRRSILLRHIVPNVTHTVIVLATLDVSVVVLAEAGLSFLGLGVQPPTPTWGGMISEGQGYLAQCPWIVFAAGGALMLVVIAVNIFGDWLRDVLDPSLEQQ